VTATAPGSGPPAPTGTVVFLDATGVALSTPPATLTNGIATLSLKFTKSTTVIAKYSGDANFLASTSTALTQTVNQPGTG
jgi:hypothetical protein